MTASVSSGRALLSALGVSLSFAIGIGALSSCDHNHDGGRDPASSAQSLRELIAQVVGDPQKLRVPATDEALPQPRLPNGAIDPAFAVTEAKRYLGKQLFFDPIRTNRVDPAYGGVLATAQTGSCGTCHLGEAAGKAGQVINLSLGGAGRGYVDADGVLRFDRFVEPGLRDTVPTPLDVVQGGVLVASGRFDAVDSVPRLAPSLIGVAFNARLMVDGKAGEAHGAVPGAANPEGLPAAENLVEIECDAHRMLGAQSDALQAIPVYLKLFADAFPEETAQAARTRDLDALVNDHTIARAIATFLRTVVTRDTPWDRFLVGDDGALSPQQVRGARLFLTPATSGGAGCISCHSGPMLDKQLGDEDGLLVEENFHNVGIGDHPLQELAREALNDPQHHDTGRGAITGLATDAFEFRVPTLRQLKDGRQFTHSGMFASVREVVEYFDGGVPADRVAGAAATLTQRFTHPRGKDAPPGLGLSAQQIDDLTEFLENGLYDPAFATDTPGSPTRAFELTEAELAYSVHRPDLAALGAVDGITAGGRCVANDDLLSRIDRGFMLPDVTALCALEIAGTTFRPGARTDHVVLMNTGPVPLRSPLTIAVALPPGVSLASADGVTSEVPVPGLPFQRVVVGGGLLGRGASVAFDVVLAAKDASGVTYTTTVFCGTKLP